MPPKAFISHDDYIASQPEDMQRILTTVRATISKAVPEAVEVISYNMPSFKLNGRVLMYFAGWTGHYAIYPGSAATLAAMSSALMHYDVSKGTIRFNKTAPVPVKVIAEIAKRRAQENAVRAETSKAKAKSQSNSKSKSKK
jgi:uncharacterized protein YdhG (YjbR/CyaY superfamily)